MSSGFCILMGGGDWWFVGGWGCECCFVECGEGVRFLDFAVVQGWELWGLVWVWEWCGVVWCGCGNGVV